jgi:molybdate transport system permease protein
MSGLTAGEIEIVLLSLRVALVATVASAPAAVCVAVLLARGQFRGRGLLNVAVHLPLVLPPVVTGYLLLRVFGRRGWVGEFLGDTIGLEFAFRWTGAALAAAVMGFPLLVRAVRLAIESVDRRLEEAAATLGARPIWSLLTVTLPLALPGLLAGLTLAFAKALGEFGATITFVSNIPGETQTLALAIYSGLEVPGGGDMVSRLVWLSVAVSVGALAISELLARRMQRIWT